MTETEAILSANHAGEPLLTARDVAALWHISERQVLRLVAEGRLPAFTLPGTRSLRFRAQDVNAAPRPKPPRPAAPRSKPARPSARGIARRPAA